MKAKFNPILLAKKRSNRIILVDLLFAFMPIFILLFIRIQTGDFSRFFTKSDPSIIALILIGQSIAKFGFSNSANESRKSNSFILIIFTFLVVVFIFTAIILVTIEISNSVKLITYILQYLFVLIDALTYYFIGNISIIIGENKNISLSDIEDVEKTEKKKMVPGQKVRNIFRKIF
jgi:FlaA1/EpsC-like NDP-sugar epimerase